MKESKKKNNLVIEAKQLKKIYNKGEPSQVDALKDVTLEVSSGEIVAIMGESGSGKTTLLNCLSGIDTVSSGQILIENEDLAQMSDRKRTSYRARRMGFIFQTFNLIPVLTAVENVEMPLLITGVSPKVARKKAVELLEKVGLSQRQNHKPGELSGGQRQRVTIARALINDPAVIWADEPTGNLDSKTAHEIMELITGVNKEFGATVVMVTHSDDIARYADRIVKMDSGTIV